MHFDVVLPDITNPIWLIAPLVLVYIIGIWTARRAPVLMMATIEPDRYYLTAFVWLISPLVVPVVLVVQGIGWGLYLLGCVIGAGQKGTD